MGVVITSVRNQIGPLANHDVLIYDLFILFIYLGIYIAFNTHITTDSFLGRGNQYIYLVKVLGPYSRKVLARAYRLNVETLASSFFPKTAKTFVLGLVAFTKNLRLILSLAKGST